MKAKGVAEFGICGVAAAVANAIYNAAGVRVRDCPITLDKLIVRMPMSALGAVSTTAFILEGCCRLHLGEGRGYDNPMSLTAIRRELRGLADPDNAKAMQRYFKTGPGEYGEGDKFFGIAVPDLRRLARAHRDSTIAGRRSLLRSKWHEERVLALLILVERYRRASEAEREEIFRFYLAHTRYINNWDLVDCSAEYVVGAHLDSSNVELLTKLAQSGSVWERRIAIISTRRWIKEGTFGPTLQIAQMLLGDRHDLIHKACGWMLREVADRDRARAEAFLRQHCKTMPRTMLRYAIEKFPQALRQKYLSGAVRQHSSFPRRRGSSPGPDYAG